MDAFIGGTVLDSDINAAALGLGLYVYVCGGIPADGLSVRAEVISSLRYVVEVGNFLEEPLLYCINIHSISLLIPYVSTRPKRTACR